MMRELADKITADTAEFERLVEEVRRAQAEFDANESDAAANAWADAVIALGEQCGKMLVYMRPAAEALAPRPMRGKARR